MYNGMNWVICVIWGSICELSYETWVGARGSFAPCFHSVLAVNLLHLPAVSVLSASSAVNLAECVSLE
jgi:hypothetical protein